MKKNLRTPSHRERVKTRAVPSPETPPLCKACACPFLFQTQKKAKKFDFAIFEEVRREVTTEPIAYMYARLRKIENGMYANTPLEKVVLALFLEIATLQSIIVSNFQTLSNEL